MTIPILTKSDGDLSVAGVLLLICLVVLPIGCGIRSAERATRPLYRAGQYVYWVMGEQRVQVLWYNRLDDTYGVRLTNGRQETFKTLELSASPGAPYPKRVD